MEMIQIQNKGLCNTKLNIKGELYELDENGVLTCSELVASTLIGTPGWRKYTRDFESELTSARSRKMRAEAEFRAAKKKLATADEALEKLEKELAREEAAAKEEPKRAPVTGPDKPGFPEDEEPSASWTKDQLLAYAKYEELDFPSNPTKDQLLSAIQEQLEFE